MSRKLLVNIHLYLATFLTPVILMIAISGGLYLFGFKGTTETTVVYEGAASELNLKAEDLDGEVRTVLEKLGFDSTFDYIKSRGNTVMTRPTSREFYTLVVKDDVLTVSQENPDFIKSIVELHKGHGPSLFKVFQQIASFGLLFILLSGLWMALITKSMRKNAIIITSAGCLMTLLLAFI